MKEFILVTVFIYRRQPCQGELTVRARDFNSAIKKANQAGHNIDVIQSMKLNGMEATCHA